MNDAKGQPLAIGDIVLVPCYVTEVVAGSHVVCKMIACGMQGPHLHAAWFHPLQVVKADLDSINVRVVRDGDAIILK